MVAVHYNVCVKNLKEEMYESNNNQLYAIISQLQAILHHIKSSKYSLRNVPGSTDTSLFYAQSPSDHPSYIYQEEWAPVCLLHQIPAYREMIILMLVKYFTLNRFIFKLNVFIFNIVIKDYAMQIKMYNFLLMNMIISYSRIQ